MKTYLRTPGRAFRVVVLITILNCRATTPLKGQELSLQAVVTPSTVIVKNGEPVPFAVHGFIEFKSLAELFPYVEAQTQRWNGKISEEERRQLARRLLREGV